MERVTGVEPVSHPWQGYIIAAIRYPRAIELCKDPTNPYQKRQEQTPKSRLTWGLCAFFAPNGAVYARELFLSVLCSDGKVQ